MTSSDELNVKLRSVQKSNARLIGEFQMNRVLSKLNYGSQSDPDTALEAWFDRIEGEWVLKFSGNAWKLAYEKVLREERFLLERTIASRKSSLEEFEGIAVKLLNNGIQVSI